MKFVYQKKIVIAMKRKGKKKDTIKCLFST